MDVLTPARRRAIALSAGVLLVLVLLVRHLAHGGSQGALAPAPRPPAGTAKAQGTRLFVHVVGAVRRPGLYRLPDGSRTADALRRAGGATRKADLEAVNLAAPLADGLQVVVPRRMPAVATGGVAGGSETGGSEAAAGPVHLNTATLEQLDALPGIGPVTAQKILDYRQEHGAFTSLDDLDAVPGIGPARMEQLRDLVAP